MATQTRVLELEGDGPGLVLFHGFGDSADTWRPLLDVLGRRGQRALAVDLPGFGAASRLGPGAILPQLDAFAGALVERVAAEIGPRGDRRRQLARRRRLAAARRAGRPAARRRRPDRARRVSTCRAGSTSSTATRSSARVLALPVPIPRRALDARRRGGVQAARVRPARAADGRVISAMAAHHADRASVRRLLDTGPAAAARARATASTSTARRVSGAADLGDEGPDGQPHRARACSARRCRTREVVLLEGCGHCPQLEETDRVAELLLAFAEQAALACVVSVAREARRPASCSPRALWADPGLRRRSAVAVADSRPRGACPGVTVAGIDVAGQTRTELDDDAARAGAPTSSSGP